MKKDRVLNNIWFMLKKVLVYCPSYAVITVVGSLLASMLSVLNVFFLKTVVDAVSSVETLALILRHILFFTIVNVFILSFLINSIISFKE